MARKRSSPNKGVETNEPKTMDPPADDAGKQEEPQPVQPPNADGDAKVRAAEEAGEHADESVQDEPAVTATTQSELEAALGLPQKALDADPVLAVNSDGEIEKVDLTPAPEPVMFEVENISMIVIHCSYTPSDQEVTLAQLDQAHKDRGWGKIGYHYLVHRNGVVERGRDIAEVGRHVFGFNEMSIGVCMVGGLGNTGVPVEGKDAYTTEQWIAMDALLTEIVNQFPNNTLAVVGHRDLIGHGTFDGLVDDWAAMQTCPAFDVAAWLENKPDGRW